MREGGITMKSLTRWDPFNIMRRWDPFEEFHTMQYEMDRLFNRMLNRKPAREETGTWLPSIESFVKDNKLVFRAELPGVDPKDLDVSVTDRELIIKGERKHERDTKEENYVYREITYGSFERHFMLPEGAKTEELKATYTNGILEITMPAPAVSTAKKIEIEAQKDAPLASEEEKVKKAA
jgi:HSP20 family protein